MHIYEQIQGSDAQSSKNTRVFEGPVQNIRIFTSKTSPQILKGGHKYVPRMPCGRGKGRVNPPHKKAV